MTSSAFQLFEAGIEDVQQHIMVAEHIREQTTPIISCAYDNLLRDAVIKTVGNTDAYLSKIMFELLLDRRAIFSTNLSSRGDTRLTFTLKELSEVIIDVSQDPLHNNLTLRRILDTKLCSLALQNHNVPHQFSRFFGVEDFWNLTQKHQDVSKLTNGRDVHSHYTSLTERRNAISHNRDQSVTNTMSQTPITRDFVDTGVITTRIIAETFEKEVVSRY